MKLAAVLSLVFHVAIGYALYANLYHKTPKPKPVVYQLEFAKPFVPESDKKQVEDAPPPKPPPPPPEPKVEKEPEPEKVAKKPDPPKPKPEPKKEEPKPKPKPPEKKPEPKKEVVKKPDPPKPKPVPKKPPEKQPEVVAKAQTKKGVQTEALPNILSGWARLVQRKVERFWAIPGGIQLTAANKEVHISFWVDRNGNLLGKPEIVQDAADPTLGASAIRAITAAVPLPPLPNEFQGKEQQVLYVFNIME
jgi:TonB family protein